MADIEEGAREHAVDRSRHPWVTGAVTARLTLMVVSPLSVFALLVVLLVANDAKEATEFSMELAASEGLGNATAGETLLSPAFGLKLRVKNARVLQPWCCDSGGEVVVSYSDAALAWGRVPPFCVQRRAPTELTLVPWGSGVGLTEDVRQRLASELRAGTAQVTVGMKLFYDARDWSSPPRYWGTSLQLFQLTLGATHGAQD